MIAALIVFVLIPMFLSFVTFLIKDVSDSRNIKRAEPSWNSQVINKPNFNKKKKHALASAEIEDLNDVVIPDFEEEFQSKQNEEVSLSEITNPAISVEEPEAFEHSMPTDDMEENIEELLAATAEMFNVDNTKIVNNFPMDEDIPPESNNENAAELQAIAEESVIGEENWYFVEKSYGRKIADMITASPDWGLETGVSYVMFGKIEGEFLNSFGDRIKLMGLPKDFKSDEHMLVQGNFITADLFSVVEMVSATDASNGANFEVINVAFS